MSLLRSIAVGLRSLFRKEHVEGELDEELRKLPGDGSRGKGEARREPQRRPSCRALGTGQSGHYEGSRPLRRLGILCRDVLARSALWAARTSKKFGLCHYRSAHANSRSWD